MLTLKKHREEHSSSRGFTIAELGAGMGVFALAAAMMAPVAMNAATSSLTGETVITVADSDGRKPITTPPVDAVEVTVVDANGNDVKTVTVNDPSATSTVISGLDSNATYTFEVAKVNMAGKSAKATAALEYKQTGTRAENYTVTEEFTDTASETVGSVAEQADDITRPIYETVTDYSVHIMKDALETYKVPVEKTGTRDKTIKVSEPYTVSVPYEVEKWRTKTVMVNESRSRNVTKYRTERYSYNHVHTSSYNHDHYTSYNHVHTESYSYNHVHESRSSYNHRHSSSYCHYHSRYNSCHRHTSYSNHTHYTTSRSNHTHYGTRSTNHTHQERSNHTHYVNTDHLHTDGLRQVSYTEVEYYTVPVPKEVPEKYYVTQYRNETRSRMVDKVVKESYKYTVMEDRQRTIQVFDRYGTKQELRGYEKYTYYRLCYSERNFGGGKGAQKCETSMAPKSKTITWQFTNTKVVPKTRYHAVYNHVKKAPEVRAPSGYVVFKASTLSKGRVMSSGEVAAVGSGVSGVSKGATKSFYRWSGKTFTFNGEQYVQVHNWALSK